MVMLYSVRPQGLPLSRGRRVLQCLRQLGWTQIGVKVAVSSACSVVPVLIRRAMVAVTGVLSSMALSSVRFDLIWADADPLEFANDFIWINAKAL
jgi:hypothetical protein